MRKSVVVIAACASIGDVTSIEDINFCKQLDANLHNKSMEEVSRVLGKPVHATVTDGFMRKYVTYINYNHLRIVVDFLQGEVLTVKCYSK